MEALAELAKRLMKEHGSPHPPQWKVSAEGWAKLESEVGSSVPMWAREALEPLNGFGPVYFGKVDPEGMMEEHWEGMGLFLEPDVCRDQRCYGPMDEVGGGWLLIAEDARGDTIWMEFDGDGVDAQHGGVVEAWDHEACTPYFQWPTWRAFFEHVRTCRDSE